MFKTVGSDYVPQFPDGSKLSNDRTTFTASDGTVILFGYSGYLLANAAGPLGIGTKITFPDGTVWDFNYQTDYYSNMFYYCDYEYGCMWIGDVNYFVRLNSINSSTGYQVKLTYAGGAIIQGYPSSYAPWTQITKATAINNAVEYCDPGAPCSLTNSWPEATYTGWNAQSGAIAAATDPVGRATNYSYSVTSGVQRITGVRPPGAASDTITYNYDGTFKISTVVSAGGTWTYSYPTGSTTVSNPLSQPRTIYYGGDGLVWKVTEGGLSTNYGYCPGTATCPSGLIQTVIKPEGNYFTYAYDDRGNVTSVVQTEKPSTGYSSITTSATYPSGCSNPKICNKPMTTTDARGQTTDYSYDPAHGGLTSITLPADVGGIRPQTRITYSNYQGYYKNSGGSIIASGLDIALPIKIAQCRTSSYCSGGADERKTVIDYGPQSSGTANNLNAVNATTSRGDNALAATTAITYDNYGRPATIDGPLSADTLSITYNLAGQVLTKVAPDPDDTDAALYPATKYHYDAWGHADIVQTGTVTNLAGSGWSETQRTEFEYDGYGRTIRQKAQSAGGAANYQISETVYDLWAGSNALECEWT